MAITQQDCEAQLVKKTSESIVRIAANGGRGRVAYKNPETGSLGVGEIDQDGALSILSWWLDRRAAECWLAISEGRTFSASETEFLHAWTLHRTAGTASAPSLTVSEAERLVGQAATVAYAGEAPNSLDDQVFNPIEPIPDWWMLEAVFGQSPRSLAVKEQAEARLNHRFQHAQQAFLDEVNAAREEYMGTRFAAAAE